MKVAARLLNAGKRRPRPVSASVIRGLSSAEKKEAEGTRATETETETEPHAGRVWSFMHLAGQPEEEKHHAPKGLEKVITELQKHHEESMRQIESYNYGVLMKDKKDDINALVESFTAPALAAALRDRETSLHSAAHLLQAGDTEGLKKVLKPFLGSQVALSRQAQRVMELSSRFTPSHMRRLKKHLNRLPRHLERRMEHRASVMVPLCNVDGIASILFTKRSGMLRTHPDEVCFPGGKVDADADETIISTALREMGEEVGIQDPRVEVLGVLRCDWSEVASLVGVAVTPVVGFVGEINGDNLHANPDEVSHCFTIPLKTVMDVKHWDSVGRKAPVFTGGPYPVWGLTGYILHRLTTSILDPITTYSVAT
ncbi:unnamed protein product [Chrysoparadoxa australica]